MSGELSSLRDQAAMTRLLILSELNRDPVSSLSDIARRLGVTLAAVSVHAKVLRSEGSLDRTNGLTPKGMQALQDRTRGLKQAVDGIATRLAMIRAASARAGGQICAGERVGLHMREGDLWATPKYHDSTSTGVATNDASDGEEVIIKDLAGIVQIDPGSISICAVPSPSDGGVAKVDMKALRLVLRGLNYEKVGALGTGPVVLARRLGKVDFEFAADHAAFNAAELGVSALLFVSRDALPGLADVFVEKNKHTLRRIEIRSFHAP